VKETITSRGVTFARPQADEKTEQASILNLVHLLGGRAYVLGTRRAQYCGVCGARTTDQGTRQTEGLADLAIYLPPPSGDRDRSRGWVFLWVECKGKHGTLSPEQVAFRDYCVRARVPHLVGGIGTFLEWCQHGGWVRG
jgi:hypothetical protein